MNIYELTYAESKEKAINYTIQQLEDSINDVNKRIDSLKQEHEHLLQERKAYSDLIEQKLQH